MRIALAAFCLAAAATGHAQDAFRLERDAVVVDAMAHWRAWSAPVGAVALDDTASALRPRFLRRHIDALRNCTDFRTVVAGGDTVVGGVQDAGANLDLAAHVFDGDPATFWEPDTALPLDQWFVEINLGRSVIAQQVVVRFVDEGLGDPFLKFRVLLSDGTVTDETGRQRGLRWFRAGQVARRNKDERLFVFDVQPRRPVAAGVTGEVAQIVRFEALDSDLDLAEELTPEAYAALPEADRGAVQYFRQTVAGRQILIDQPTWEALSPDFRGPVRYFRRERPRLAGVEVYTPGDNIVALTQRLANRQSVLFENIIRNLSTDGIYASFYPLRVYDPLRDENQVEIDLGARYWLDRVRVVSPRDPLRGYQVRLSDGTLDPAGVRTWTDLGEQLNPQAHLQLEETFPPRQVRFLELRRLSIAGATAETGTVSEIQAYGEGYLSDVTLESPMLRLPGTRLFTTADWDADLPPGTRLELRTRSGDDIVQERHYYDRFGREISEQEWNATSTRSRGPRTSVDLPAGDWSTWSQEYLRPGEAFKSPSPRRRLLVQVRLRTDEPLRAAALRSLRLGLGPPLVEQIFAEVVPNDGVEPGRDQDFTLQVRPVFETFNPGFDRLRLRSSSSAPVELLSVRRGTEEQLRDAGTAELLYPGALRVEPLDDGSVELIFPRRVTFTADVVQVRFRTRVYLNGTEFAAEVRNDAQPGVVQLASAGDATRLLDSESLVVLASVERSGLLGDLRAEPPVVTPNGDGINDTADLVFAVYVVKGEHRLDLGVFDLSGRRVRDLAWTTDRPSGQHRVPFDGRDDAGRRLPPGVYVVRASLSTQADAAGTDAAGLVHVAY